ncbi:hypothetical protein CPB86DRAFT_91164 [Serendipita vermifera]|nr:hypothetical protein CPB86DRAFT_91164 [Serendipita vermifera]
MLMDASSSVQEVHTQFVHPFPKPPLARRPSEAGVDLKGIPGEKFIRPTPRPSTGSTTKSSHSRSSKASEGGSITLHVLVSSVIHTIGFTSDYYSILY